ncbi:MAG TPA: orotidine-5'-phosphate decarboxylase [Patescibacteria group bacterium]|nr:orotidine-5'-phosphate decarboxylase [Patescibacteria group bacterium]
MRNPLIIALDVPDLANARLILGSTADVTDVYKIGTQLFTAEGPDSIRLVQSYGKRVFLDLKFHDIPNTVAESVRFAIRHGVWMMNIHISGGEEMLKAAHRVVSNQEKESPLLVGVTVLTSMNDDQWHKVFGENALPISAQGVRMALLAQSCGLDGVVASPQEITQIREVCRHDFIIVTPGVRPTWAATNDQARVMTPGEAIRLGADYLVIGRPITAAKNPAEAARLILAEIKEARNLRGE